jgi:hypothetical protein
MLNALQKFFIQRNTHLLLETCFKSIYIVCADLYCLFCHLIAQTKLTRYTRTHDFHTRHTSRIGVGPLHTELYICIIMHLRARVKKVRAIIRFAISNCIQADV